MAKRKSYRQMVAEEDAASDALNAVVPDAGDEVIAALIADHAVKQLPSSRLMARADAWEWLVEVVRAEER